MRQTITPIKLRQSPRRQSKLRLCFYLSALGATLLVAAIAFSADGEEAASLPETSVREAPSTAESLPPAESSHPTESSPTAEPLPAPSNYFQEFVHVEGMRTPMGECIHRFLESFKMRNGGERSPACHIPFVVISLAFEVHEVAESFCVLAEEASRVSVGQIVLVQNGVNLGFARHMSEVSLLSAANPTRVVLYRSPVFGGIAWAYNRAMEHIIATTESERIESSFTLFMSANANVTMTGDGTVPGGDAFLRESCREFASLVSQQTAHRGVLGDAVVDRAASRDGGRVNLVQSAALAAAAVATPGRGVILGAAAAAWKADAPRASLFSGIEASPSAPPESVAALPRAARVGLGFFPSLKGDFSTLFVSYTAMRIVGGFDENFLMMSSTAAMLADWTWRNAVLGLESFPMAARGKLGEARRRLSYPRGGPLSRPAEWIHKFVYGAPEHQEASQYMVAKWGVAPDELPSKLGGDGAAVFSHPYQSSGVSADMWVLDTRRLALIRDDSEFRTRPQLVTGYNASWVSAS